MHRAVSCAIVSLAIAGCKQQERSAGRGSAAPPALDATVVTTPDAAPRAASPQWYRAVAKAPDGLEAIFLLGIPPAGAPGHAIFRMGHQDIAAGATFEGGKLSIPMPIHQTKIEAMIGADGALTGTFTIDWKAVEPSSIEVTGTPLDNPTLSALATVPPTGVPIDFGAARTTFKLAMKDSGTAKLAVEQVAPGNFEAAIGFETANLIYLAGNGRDRSLVLTGFDGTGGYRVELTLDDKLANATGRFAAGHRFDWRETFTAIRTEDFRLAIKPRTTKPDVKTELPKLPELAALPEGPMVVQIAGSWCITCRFATPVLVEMQKEYAPRGLQFVTLLYELTDDPAADAKQAATFKATYGVPWPVVAVPGDIEALADALPEGLTGIEPSSFPLTLFVAKDRTLVALRAGFPGAHTPELASVKAELRAHADKLVGK